MELKVEWPTADLKRMAAQIERAQLKLGKSLEQSVVWAGLLLARSAAVRTSTAPKNRKNIKNDGTKEILIDGKMRIASRKAFPYYREIWVDGPENIKYWFLKSRSDDKHKKIGRAGVAKKSWIWMLPWIKGKGGSRRACEVNKKVSLFETVIEMANMLKYIQHALKVSDGNLLLNEALGKTASRMEKIIDDKLRKMPL